MKTSTESQPVYLAQVTINLLDMYSPRFSKWYTQVFLWLEKSFGTCGWDFRRSSRWWFNHTDPTTTFVFHSSDDRTLFVLAFGEVTMTVIDTDYSNLRFK